jgi:ribosomal protein S18 acetylase RimI-like enzyme
VSVEIRQVGTRDAALFNRVADDVFDLAVDRDRLVRYLASPGHFMIVALEGGEIVGQCAAVIHHHPDKATELYIDEVAVAPAFQRRGIAKDMLDAMIALGRAQGCEEAWVGTEHDNAAARRLYESSGAAAEHFVMYVYDL